MIKQRTCVICKKKRDKSELFRFYMLDFMVNDITADEPKKQVREIVIDTHHRLKTRGFYFCKDNENCEKYLPNWVKKKKKERKHA